MQSKRSQDIRWQQRFANFRKALDRLGEAIRMIGNLPDGSLGDLAAEGLIQRFEFTHELAWKVMKDYLEYQGYKIIGSRDAIRHALQTSLVEDEEWMQSIEARNLTSHTYDENKANEVICEIESIYYPLMEKFRDKMEKLISDEG